jgi:regulator of nonsense transcripts 2
VPGILYKDAGSSSETKVIADSADSATTAVTGESSSEADKNVDILKEIEKIEKELEELNQTMISQPSSEQPETPGKDDEKEPTSSATTALLDEINKEVQNQPANLSNANMKTLMDLYIVELANCVSRDSIDKAAKEFCLNLNTKANRKRLVTTLFQVQRTRLDLLPFYARLAAILNPIMPEISSDLASLLMNEFRFLVRKKDQINVESKIKVARYIAELIKFNIFPRTDAFNCLKTLLADFRHHNIEMFCNLLDVCGRFLYRNAETHMKMKLILVSSVY